MSLDDNVTGEKVNWFAKSLAPPVPPALVAEDVCLFVLVDGRMFVSEDKEFRLFNFSISKRDNNEK